MDPPSLTRFEDRFEQIVRTLTSSAVTNETKQRILKRAVSQCPSITMEFLGLKVPSLLDSASMVMLIREAYFNKNILPLLHGSVEELAEAHSLFHLSAANNQDMPISRYFEADISILGFWILSVGFLVVKDPGTVLESQYSTRTPGVIGCNLIWLGYEEFGKVHGFDAFETYMCPKEVHPLIFAQMCTLYHQGKDQTKPNLHASNSSPKDHQTETIQVTNSNVNFHSTTEDLSPLDATLGQVWVGSLHQAQGLSCMIEARFQNNLPLGVVVNHTAVTPSKSNKVPVTLVNTNSYNVWIRQQLLAADIVEVDHCPWDYHSTMSRDGSEVQFLFKPVPTPDVQANIFSVDATQTGKEAGELKTTNRVEPEERPKFGPRPRFNSKNFDFDKELVRLPFPVNFGEVKLSLSQQKRFLELIYDHQGVFSLCDEDLGLCDCLKHTIPTMTTKPVYLPHHTIPVQLQTEVRKCLDTWLKQGIICPSRSLHASQVVIVRKKTGEIHLCINFRALNAVTVRDSFPLPRIEEALQAVKSAMCFTSIDLAQGYLQLAMDEADIHKTAFHAGSSGLYEFTHMPFGLSNVGASFVASWRCVLVTNNISHSCFILTTSAFLAALSMRC